MNFRIFITIIYCAFAIAGDLDGSLLSVEEMNFIRNHPVRMNEVFQDHYMNLRQLLGREFSDLNEPEVLGIFCSLVAYEAAPYGPLQQPLANLDVPTLLRLPYLKCDLYCVLAWELFDISKVGMKPTVNFHVVGWEGGPVGNHCFLFICSEKGRGVLVDPTIGLVARTSFDEVASGKPIPANNIVSFYNGNEWNWLRQKEIDALFFGGFRPSHLLYYASHFDSYVRPGHERYWLTPAAQRRF